MKKYDIESYILEALESLEYEDIESCKRELEELLRRLKEEDPDLEFEKPSGKRVLIKGFDSEKEAHEWIKTEKILAEKLGRKPGYYEVEKAISPLGTEVWYVYQILEEKKHWLFKDLPEKPKKPLRATLEPYIEAARVKPLTEWAKPVGEEWFKARKLTPLAVGSNFKPYEGCTLIESRPPSTDPASLGRLTKAIEEGVDDYSKKALVYDEREFMYKLIEVSGG